MSLADQNTTIATDVTKQLAAYIVAAKPGDAAEAFRKEGVRTFFNYIAVAVGGAKEETVDIAVKALSPFFGKSEATLLGRSEKTDILHAALINGISSHVMDFDDTHLKTVIHPGGPVISAILALAERMPVSGKDFLNALLLGVDIECRIGNNVYPDHYDRGWHITGTTGSIGAAIAAGKLLGLNELQMQWAIGIACSQPVGLREMFGTMTKPFHPGKAAQNGLMSALLAQGGYTASEQPLEAKRGWSNVLSTKQDYNEILGELGVRNEISFNSYKPFACGIVIHPTIDACVKLREKHGLKAENIAKIDAAVHPLVLELTGKKTPRTGLEGKFSVYHSASVAIIHGAARDAQYRDEVVADPKVVALRDKVNAFVDPAMHEDQCKVVVTMNDGSKHELFIEHALGSHAQPLTDADLQGKFDALVLDILPKDKTKKLSDLSWDLENLADVSAVAKAAQN